MANSAVLVGDQSGQVLIKQYNWSQYFSAGTKVQGIKSHQQFSFSADKPGL